MTKHLVCALLALFFVPIPPTQAADSLEAGVNELAQQIVRQSTARGKHTIAVAAFPHADGSLSVLSNYMVDELVLSLFSVSNSKLQIVERSQLETIIMELNRGQSGVIDISTAKELGKIHGVDALVIGSITTIGDKVRVIARMIETETGQVFSAAATTIPKTETLENLMNRGVATAHVTLTPQQRTKPRSTAVASSAGLREFKNDVLRVVFRSMYRSSDQKKINLSLLFENISADPIQLALLKGKSNKYLLDDEGGKWELSERAVGIETGSGGRGSVMTPGQQSVVLFRFESQDNTKGRVFSFAANFGRWMDPGKQMSNVRRFSVGLDNLTLSK